MLLLYILFPERERERERCIIANRSLLSLTQSLHHVEGRVFPYRKLRAAAQYTDQKRPLHNVCMPVCIHKERERERDEEDLYVSGGTGKYKANISLQVFRGYRELRERERERKKKILTSW